MRFELSETSSWFTTVRRIYLGVALVAIGIVTPLLFAGVIDRTTGILIIGSTTLGVALSILNFAGMRRGYVLVDGRGIEIRRNLSPARLYSWEEIRAVREESIACRGSFSTGAARIFGQDPNETFVTIEFRNGSGRRGRRYLPWAMSKRGRHLAVVDPMRFVEIASDHIEGAAG